MNLCWMKDKIDQIVADTQLNASIRFSAVAMGAVTVNHEPRGRIIEYDGNEEFVDLD